MGERAQFTTPRVLPMVLIGAVVIAVVVEHAATHGILPAVAGGVVGVGGSLAVIALLTWIASHLVTFAEPPDREDEDRAQVASDPFPIATLIIGLAVAVLVGREVFSAWRDGLATCAPDCSLGAPLFTGVEWVGVGVLLALGVVILLVARSGIAPRQFGSGGEDE